jgi:hypothetical protein
VSGSLLVETGLAFAPATALYLSSDSRLRWFSDFIPNIFWVWADFEVAATNFAFVSFLRSAMSCLT